MVFRSLVIVLRVKEVRPDLLEWKAIPFALEDLDSNYPTVSMNVLISFGAKGKLALVNMFGEDSILAALLGAWLEGPSKLDVQQLSLVVQPSTSIVSQ